MMTIRRKEDLTGRDTYETETCKLIRNLANDESYDKVFMMETFTANNNNRTLTIWVIIYDIFSFSFYLCFYVIILVW